MNETISGETPLRTGGQNMQEPRPVNIRPQKKRRAGYVLLVIIIIALAAALAWSYINMQQYKADEKIRTEQSIAKALDEALSDGALTADGWMKAVFVKAVIEKYSVSSEVISHLFPDKIIYKGENGVVYNDIDDRLAKNSYDWTANLTWENDRPIYKDTDGNRAMLGIDVSKYQEDIDWEKVAADGIEFAIIRIGHRGAEQGTLQEDPYFTEYMQGALDAGLKVGAYFFSQAIDEAEALEEVDFAVNALRGYDISLPVAFDMEEVPGTASRTDELTPAQVTAIAKLWCDKISEAGYTPVIYSNVRWFVSRMNLIELEDYGKWLAQYYSDPTYPYEYSLWQYTASGRVDGIAGDVDMDLYFPQ